MSTLKKVAVIGGGAYVGYQLGKATSRYVCTRTRQCTGNVYLETFDEEIE
jgi:hypothetical protein